MSGPKTSQYSIRASRIQEQQRVIAEERKKREELAARFLAAEEKRTILEKKAGRLLIVIKSLCERFPAERFDISVPSCVAPKTVDPSSLESFVTQLEIEILKAENTLRGASNQAKANEDFRSATRIAVDFCSKTSSTADEAMRKFVESKSVTQVGSSMANRRAEIDRILQRQDYFNWLDASPKLESLIMDALSVDSEHRFSALATEIRLQLQEVKKRKEVRNLGVVKAKALLDLLELEIPIGEESLKQRLELVRVGVLEFSNDLEKKALDAIALVKGVSKKRNQILAADIVKETLADLGYEAVPIEATLFTKGGKAYFRKAGWSDYCVRLTVRPDESKINFNVVRLGEQDNSSREADIEAENAWCSGYQQFVDTLASRGLDTKLTRHLPVGAVPLQSVRSDEVTLSAFSPSAKRRKTENKVRAHRGDQV